MAKLEPTERQAEYDRLTLALRGIGLLAAIVIGGGAIFYHLVEHLHWLDAFYFSVVTLATVGYGDISPHTAAGKLFTIFYILFGVGIIATFANLLLRRAALRRR